MSPDGPNGVPMEVKPESVPLYPLDGAAATPEQELLCIFGTGDFGRSLGQRLLQTGNRLVYGSRRPDNCGPVPQGAQVTHLWPGLVATCSLWGPTSVLMFVLLNLTTALSNPPSGAGSQSSQWGYMLSASQGSAVQTRPLIEILSVHVIVSVLGWKVLFKGVSSFKGAD